MAEELQRQIERKRSELARQQHELDVSGGGRGARKTAPGIAIDRSEDSATATASSGAAGTATAEAEAPNGDVHVQSSTSLDDGSPSHARRPFEFRDQLLNVDGIDRGGVRDQRLKDTTTFAKTGEPATMGQAGSLEDPFSLSG